VPHKYPVVLRHVSDHDDWQTDQPLLPQPPFCLSRCLTCLTREDRPSPGLSLDPLQITYGTELAAAGIDLVVLRDLMGHSSPETTALYVHFSDDHLAAEYAAARAVIGR
jgi:hypothetical protein